VLLKDATEAQLKRQFLKLQNENQGTSLQKSREKRREKASRKLNKISTKWLLNELKTANLFCHHFDDCK
jgi:hypothetical protein